MGVFSGKPRSLGQNGAEARKTGVLGRFRDPGCSHVDLHWPNVSLHWSGETQRHSNASQPSSAAGQRAANATQHCFAEGLLCSGEALHWFPAGQPSSAAGQRAANASHHSCAEDHHWAKRGFGAPGAPRGQKGVAPGLGRGHKGRADANGNRTEQVSVLTIDTSGAVLATVPPVAQAAHRVSWGNWVPLCQ